MATVHRQLKRASLKAKPRADLDAKVVTGEISNQYAKTLEYLAR